MSCGLCVLFWCCVFAVQYPYVIYPIALCGLNRLLGRRQLIPPSAFEPTISVICPIYNESSVIEDKLRNVLDSEYTRKHLEVIVIGDGCTDDSLEIASRIDTSRVQVIALPRAGKAAALNEGIARASGELVVFTDVGIRTAPGALRALVGHFADPNIGCVSGEDRVHGATGEGLYGRLELMIRRQESRFYSIAGASGCLYAVRRSEIRPFLAGMAPDFASVLEVVKAGKRAICEPLACGYMFSAASNKGEFARKRRTFLRGMTALFANASLLSPFRRPAFSFILISHKVLRWMSPIALVGALLSAYLLRDQAIYRGALYVQLTFYALAVLGLLLPIAAARWLPVRVCSFFLLVNAAVAAALSQWMAGVRQEVWQPTRRMA